MITCCINLTYKLLLRKSLTIILPIACIQPVSSHVACHGRLNIPQSVSIHLKKGNNSIEIHPLNVITESSSSVSVQPLVSHTRVQNTISAWGQQTDQFHVQSALLRLFKSTVTVSSYKLRTCNQPRHRLIVSNCMPGFVYRFVLFKRQTNERMK